MTSLPAAPPAARPFQPTHCLDCGYSLQGLPTAGICPECGTAYRDDTLVLWGWHSRRGTSLQRMRRRSSWGVWGLLIPLLFVVYLATEGAWMAAGLLVILYAIPIVLYLRQLNQGYSKPPRPLQVRLSPEGIGQRLGYGPMVMEPWPEGVIVQLRRPGRRAGSLRIQTETILGAIKRSYCSIQPDVQEADWPVLIAWLTERARAVGGKVRYTDS